VRERGEGRGEDLGDGLEMEMGMSMHVSGPLLRKVHSRITKRWALLKWTIGQPIVQDKSLL